MGAHFTVRLSIYYNTKAHIFKCFRISREQFSKATEIISWVLMTSLTLVVQKFCKAITRIMKTLLKTSLSLTQQPVESSGGKLSKHLKVWTYVLCDFASVMLEVALNAVD